jgi:hypothetical protein
VQEGYTKERLHLRLQRRYIFGYRGGTLEDTNRHKEVTSRCKEKVQTLNKGYKRATFWSRIMISRGFEAVKTVFGGYFGFGKKNTFSPRT